MYKNKRTLVTILLTVLSLTFLLSGCDPTGNVGDFLDENPNISNASADTDQSTDESEPPTQEGYTARPFVLQTVYTSPKTAIIAGTCEADSVIRVKDLESEKTFNAFGEYFIAEITLSSTTKTYFSITAQVEGKEESTERLLPLDYNATAEDRLDGNAVSIGKGASLFFKDLYPDYKGETLLTVSQIESFKSSIRTKINSISKRGNAEVVYVLIPSKATICQDDLPDDIKRETFSTRFDQISDALSELNGVKVINMKEAFSNSDSEYPIYSKTSSTLTEYASYLVYRELMTYISSEFPEAAPYDLSDSGYSLEWSSEDTIGGDLVYYAGLDRSVYTERFPVLKPNFNSVISADADCTCLPSEIKKYVSDTDFMLYYGAEEKAEGDAFGANEKLYFKTNRETLPSAIFYRDSSTVATVPLLAEHFDNSFFSNYDDFEINLTTAETYKTASRDTMVDYIVVMISEENIGEIIG